MRKDMWDMTTGRIACGNGRWSELVGLLRTRLEKVLEEHMEWARREMDEGADEGLGFLREILEYAAASGDRKGVERLLDNWWADYRIFFDIEEEEEEDEDWRASAELYAAVRRISEARWNLHAEEKRALLAAMEVAGRTGNGI